MTIFTRDNMIAGVQGGVYGVVLGMAGSGVTDHPWKFLGLLLLLIVAQRLR